MRTCGWTADTRLLDARGHQGEVDEIAQRPCTLAFKASQSFAHGELIERVIIAIIELTTNPEIKCVPRVIKDSVHFNANRSTKMMVCERENDHERLGTWIAEQSSGQRGCSRV